MSKIPVLLVLVLAFSGCLRDPNSSTENPRPGRTGAFIINEGLWGQGNGSLSFYDYETDSVYQKIFKSVNNEDLGDVVQSMTIIDTLGFIVVNGSDKIEVIGMNSWKRVRTIHLPAGSGPRYLAKAGKDKAYLTTYGGFFKVDLKSLSASLLSNVSTNYDEQLVLTADRVFIANSGFGYANTVTVVDAKADTELTKITVADNPLSLTLDDNGKVQVLCTGRWGDWQNPADQGTDGGLFVIDPQTNQVTKSVTISGHPQLLTTDGQATGYYILNGSVVAYNLTDLTVQNAHFADGYFYSLGFDPASDNLFILDALDYQQNGRVLKYSAQGTVVKTLPAGLIPGGITFYHPEIK